MISEQAAVCHRRSNHKVPLSIAVMQFPGGYRSVSAAIRASWRKYRGTFATRPANSSAWRTIRPDE